MQTGSTIPEVIVERIIPERIVIRIYNSVRMPVKCGKMPAITKGAGIVVVVVAIMAVIVIVINHHTVSIRSIIFRDLLIIRLPLEIPDAQLRVAPRSQ